MTTNLNDKAVTVVERIVERLPQLRASAIELANGARVFDFGVKAEGSIDAGLILSEVCMSGLGTVSIASGEIDGVGWPYVQVDTDAPTEACLLSQYAGWQIAVDKFFGMGSGPMRAVAAREELFDKLDYRESAESIVGVVETARLPDEAVIDEICAKTNVSPQNVTLLVAPTASQAGNLQVVARSVETSLHKLFELGFDVRRIRSGFGTAPLSPVATDDLQGIGRTNDAILYGGRVTLWVTGDDESMADIGPQVPSESSACYGKPFLEVFEDAGRDFYQIDPHLFSPAEIVFQNLDTGNVFRFGQVAPEILKRSFGL